MLKDNILGELFKLAGQLMKHSMGAMKSMQQNIHNQFKSEEELRKEEELKRKKE
jgi:hypothetical protein